VGTDWSRQSLGTSAAVSHLPAPGASGRLYHIRLQSLMEDYLAQVDVASLRCSYRLHAISDLGGPNHHSICNSASGNSSRISRTESKFQSGSVGLIQNRFSQASRRIKVCRGSSRITDGSQVWLSTMKYLWGGLNKVPLTYASNLVGKGFLMLERPLFELTPVLIGVDIAFGNREQNTISNAWSLKGSRPPSGSRTV